MQDNVYQFENYKLTENITLLDGEHHITPKIRKLLKEVYPNVLKGKRNILPRLKKLAARHPEVPNFQNYIVNIHVFNENYDQARDAVEVLLKEHPDYLYGKLNQAEVFLADDIPEHIPELLGESLDLKALYPEREEFHYDEFIDFNNVVVRYYMSTFNYEEARKRIDIMLDIDPYHPRTEAVDEYYNLIMMLKAEENAEEDGDFESGFEVMDRLTAIQTTAAPTFNFPEEMQWLYAQGMDIPSEKIEHILQLQRDALLDDLCQVLRDCMVRYYAFSESEGLADTKLDFPIHALLLLSELGMENAVRFILDLMRQDSDLRDFWFGDCVEDSVIPALAICGSEVPQQLASYLKEPNIDAFNKSYVATALIKIALHFPDKKEEIVGLLKEILDFFVENCADENLVDTEFLGLLIADITDAGFSVLLPQIESLFSLDIVAFWICGDYDSVQEDIVKETHINTDFLALDIHAKYAYVNKLFSRMESSYDENNAKIFEGLDSFSREESSPIVKPKKVGRNDPCPCGSGKKYKKCCINLD